MTEGRYNWDKPTVSSDDQATDNVPKKLKVVPENATIPATGWEEKKLLPSPRRQGQNLMRLDLKEEARNGSRRSRIAAMDPMEVELS